MNGLSWVPVQDHVELQLADHKWQKWETRGGQGAAIGGQYIAQQRSSNGPDALLVDGT